MDASSYETPVPSLGSVWLRSIGAATGIGLLSGTIFGSLFNVPWGLFYFSPVIGAVLGAVGGLVGGMLLGPLFAQTVRESPSAQEAVKLNSVIGAVGALVVVGLIVVFCLRDFGAQLMFFLAAPLCTSGAWTGGFVVRRSVAALLPEGVELQMNGYLKLRWVLVSSVLAGLATYAGVGSWA